MTSRLASPEHKANPYPFYERLRAESPVHRVMLPGRKTAWLVTRYADAEGVLKDARFAKDRFTVSDGDDLPPGAQGRAVAPGRRAGSAAMAARARVAGVEVVAVDGEQVGMTVE